MGKFATARRIDLDELQELARSEMGKKERQASELSGHVVEMLKRAPPLAALFERSTPMCTRFSTG
jgi:hypothetical protein